MLRSIKQLYGDKLGASDGEIGHVKDFYFDDQTWAVRYVVADTGSWLQKPVSRKYEEEYYRYYGWPYYWQGDGLWGMSGFPILELPAKPLPREPATPIGPQPEPADAHLRSTQTVGGYHLQANDGIIGHVCDFMMDTQSWAIRHLVIKTGHRFSGKEVQIPTREVARISYPDSTVFVNVTMEIVQQSPTHHLAPIGAAD